MTDSKFTRAGSVSLLDPEAIQCFRAADKAALREAAERAGGAVAAIQAKYPRLARTAPPDLSIEAFVQHGTVAWYEDAETRITLCDRCPPHGAACEGVGASCFPAGRLPVWKDAKIESTRCERYVEFKVRERLGVAGVPPLYQDRTFATWEYRTAAAEAAESTVVSLITEIQTTGAGWLVISGPRASGKTHLSSALLRNLVRKAPGVRLCYRSLPSFRMTLKEWKFKSDEPDPMLPLRRAGVLVFDDVDPEYAGPELWLKERIEDVLRERWLAMRPTVLTTHGTLSLLARTFPTLTTLTEAPTCSTVR